MGDLHLALKNVLAAVKDGGILIVTVPVETGIWGLARYCVKTLAGYPIDEIDAKRGEYPRALMTGKDISRFRGESLHAGTHFGIDWRVLEKHISAKIHIERAYTKYATTVIFARKTGDPGAPETEQIA